MCGPVLVVTDAGKEADDGVLIEPLVPDLWQAQCLVDE